MSDAISFQVGCRIMLDGWRFWHGRVAAPLQEYHEHLQLLLCKEFRILWPDGDQRFEPPYILSAIPSHYDSVRSVFSGVLEYTFAAGEKNIIDRHAEVMRRQEDALKNQYAALFYDLMLLRWPEASSRSTSWSRLRFLGLGEPVDEIDFL